MHEQHDTTGAGGELREPASDRSGFEGATYAELKRLALAQMEREPAAHTLQATALVHEAWMRLGEHAPLDHDAFLRLAAHTMRHVLVDHARRRQSLKRGGGQELLPIEALSELEQERAPDLIALDAALEELERLDQRAFQVVELRFFGGLEVKQIARLLDVGERTVKREWATARLWLHDRLRREGPGRG